MISLSQSIAELVEKVAPISSVRIGNRIDKSTWVIFFKPEATAEQQAAAQKVIDNFDLSDAAQSARDKAARKAEAAAKLTSGDPISMAVRGAIDALAEHFRTENNKRYALIKAGNLDLLEPIPKLTPQQKTAMFAAALAKE